jgi:hypothetical protein
MDLANKVAAIAKRTLPVSGVFDEVRFSAGRQKAKRASHGTGDRGGNKSAGWRVIGTSWLGLACPTSDSAVRRHRLRVGGTAVHTLAAPPLPWLAAPLPPPAGS